MVSEVRRLFRECNRNCDPYGIILLQKSYTSEFYTLDWHTLDVLMPGDTPVTLVEVVLHLVLNRTSGVDDDDTVLVLQVIE